MRRRTEALDLQHLFIGPLQKEEWKALINYEDFYEISSLGRIFGIKSQKIRRTYIDEHGKERIILSKDGKRRTHLVCELVALTFIGPAPEDHEVTHKSLGDSFHGIENLRYTPVDPGKLINRSKLTKDQVKEIRRRYQERGLSLTKTARRYGVSITTIHHIVQRNTWKHL